MNGGEDMKRLLQRELGGEPGGPQELVNRELNTDGGEDMKRLLQRELRGEPGGPQELVNRELNKKHDEISGDGDTTKKLGLSELLEQELDREFWKKLGQFTGNMSAIRDMVPSSCLSFASIEVNKLLRRMLGQEPVSQIGGTIDPEIIGWELGRVPGQEQDLESCCEINCARNKLHEDNSDLSIIGEVVHMLCVRTVSEACCFSASNWLTRTSSDAGGIEDDENNTLLHQEPTEVTLLKSSHAEIGGGDFPSEGGATADPTDSLVIITHVDTVDRDVVVSTAPPHDVDELVVVEVVVLEVDRGVEDVAVGEETEDLDGDGNVTDKAVIAKETLDFGDDGNPIVMEVLSPAEYTEIVSNVCLSLSLVDADYQ